MNFDPTTWGTVGQWASAVFAGSAFFATFYVIQRDAKLRRYARASRVAYYAYRPEDYFGYKVKNLSDEPIYEVMIYEPNGKVLSLRHVIMPGDEDGVFYPDRNYSGPDPQVQFRDNGGLLWNRDTKGVLRQRLDKPNFGKLWKKIRPDKD